MYAKFIIYGNDSIITNHGVSDKEGNNSTPVVPYEVKIFEGKRFSYSKARIKSKDDYYKMSKNLGSFHVLSSLPSDLNDGEESSYAMDFEIIILTLYEQDGTPSHYISSEDSVLFIMNDAGKTIDKIACRNNH